MGLLQLGFLVNLMNQPVMLGYINAAALIIILSQTQSALGLSLQNTSGTVTRFIDTVAHLMDLNGATLLVSLISIGILYVFRYQMDAFLSRWQIHPLFRFAVSRSGALFAVVAGVLLSSAFDLNDRFGVKTIGDIPRGLPALTFGPFETSHVDQLMLGALAIAFVGLMEAVSTANSLTSKRHQTLDPNRELVAMGVANVSAAFSSGFAGTTSLSRSAVNAAAGGKTGLSSIVASILLALVVVILSPIFSTLPNAVLSAIIVFSVISLFDIRSIKQVWHYDRVETLPFFVTFAIVLLFNIPIGILGGIVSAIGLHLWRTARPSVVQLGRIEYTNYYRDVKEYETMPIPGVLIVRIDESLYFANAQYIELYVRNLIAVDDDTDFVVLACAAINRIDASSLDTLAALVEEFHLIGIEIYFAELKEQVTHQLKRVHFTKQVGEGRFFPSIHTAIESIGRLPDEHLPIG
jgi:SulP family sulfate permease